MWFRFFTGILLVNPTPRPTAAPVPCPLLACQILLEGLQQLLVIAVSDGQENGSSMSKEMVLAVVLVALLLLFWHRIEWWILPRSKTMYSRLVRNVWGLSSHYLIFY